MKNVIELLETFETVPVSERLSWLINIEKTLIQTALENEDVLFLFDCLLKIDYFEDKPCWLALLSILEKLVTDDKIPLLFELFTNGQDQEQLRIAVSWLLGRRKVADMEFFLNIACNDPSPSVRLQGISYLSVNVENSNYWLLKVLKNNDRPNLAFTIQSLNKIENKDGTDKELIELLLKYLNDEDHLIVLTALLELLRTNLEEFVAPLTYLMHNHKVISVRKMAAYGLGRLGSTLALPALIWIAQNDTEMELRLTAILALGDLRSNLAVEPLLGILKEDTPLLIPAIIQVLAALGVDASN